MALPKIKVPLYDITLPISKKQIQFRPYTVGDEKILLAAASAREADTAFYIRNTVQVIKNCTNNELDIESLPSIDVEYLLLFIRAKSVDEKIEVKYYDKDDDKTYPVSIDLEKFQVVTPENHKTKIELTDTIGMVMKDLTFANKMSYGMKFTEKNKTDIIYEIIVDSIKMIYDGDETYVIGDNTTKEEAREFVESLAGASEKLYDFVGSMPQLQVDVTLPTGKVKTFTGNEIDFLALSPGT